MNPPVLQLLYVLFPELPASDAVVDELDRQAFLRLRNENVLDFVSDFVVVHCIELEIYIRTGFPQGFLNLDIGLRPVEKHGYLIPLGWKCSGVLEQQHGGFHSGILDSLHFFNSRKKGTSLNRPGLSLLEPPEILADPYIRTEEYIEEKADAGQKDKDEKPADSAVGVSLFEKDHSGDKNSVRPEKACGVFHEDVRKFAQEVIEYISKGMPLRHGQTDGLKDCRPVGQQKDDRAEPQKKQQCDQISVFSSHSLSLSKASSSVLENRAEGEFQIMTWKFSSMSLLKSRE